MPDDIVQTAANKAGRVTAVLAPVAAAAVGFHLLDLAQAHQITDAIVAVYTGVLVAISVVQLYLPAVRGGLGRLFHKNAKP